MYKGTGEKAARRYIGRQEFEKIIDNPKSYEDKTITIEITPPKTERRTKGREKADALELITEYLRRKLGESKRETLFNLIAEREVQRKGLAKRQRETRAKIRKLQAELAEYEKAVQAGMEGKDKRILSIADKAIRDFEKDTLADTLAKQKELRKAENEHTAKIEKAVKAGKEKGTLTEAEVGNITAEMKTFEKTQSAIDTAIALVDKTLNDEASFLDIVSAAVKTDTQRKAGSKRQGEYRKRKTGAK